MLGLFLTCAVIYLLLTGGLVLFASGHVREGVLSQTSAAAARERPAGRRAARVAVVVPITGGAPDLELTLGSLLSQQHPNHEVVMVTRDADDPAAPVVQRLCARVPHVRHVFGGAAQGCGQKNHNILRGLETVRARPAILVFCDANHWAPPHFLETLVRPVEEGQAVLASGYHRVRAEDHALGSLGMLLSVMALHMLQGLPFITQPWGGATAVSAEAFRAFGMDRIWAETVVDDYSLGCRFLKEGIRSRPVSDACLLTTVRGQTLGAWIHWLTRQLMFLKFFEPMIWIMAIPVAGILVFPLLVSILALPGGALGWLSPAFSMAAAVFVAWFGCLALLLKRLVPEPIPAPRWIAAFVVMHFVTVWCYLRTWLTSDLSWRGITYSVGKGGIVRGIRGGGLR
jgi:cellulose synthase/poly-beta-1,6-N-acetylglucosamine synthase-like glycosyltransferase